MKNRLQIHTFGNLRVLLDDKPVSGFISRKVEALLIYLARNPREHARETLANLLWDDLPQNRALANLRQALSSLQKFLSPYLLVTRHTLRMNPESEVWLDVAILEQTIAIARSHLVAEQALNRSIVDHLAQALLLYQGEFLQGFYVRDASEFENWLLIERERIRQQVIESFDWLIEYTIAQGLYPSGIEYATRRLQLDPLAEQTYRQLMTLLARSGQRAAALEQFETCRAILNKELGVEPEEETTLLAQQIRAGQLETPHPRTFLMKIPQQITPFVGREKELTEICEILARPDCCLLTLVGPGGIGKTRLAVEAGNRMANKFTNGVVFVDLQTLRSANSLATTIVDAISIPLSPSEEPLTRLQHYLRERELLLALDGFEHLLDGAHILLDLLKFAPNMKLLVTSREVLNLNAEWLYRVEGLVVPPDNNQENITEYDAARLFMERAQRIRPDFSLASDEGQHVIEICRLAGGMPLAIEIAASWIRALDISAIIEEMRRNIDFLATNLRDIPERHRSIQAIFAQTWEMLNEYEREVFQRLSVFRGGFRYEAAEKVAGASIAILLSFIDKSLLRLDANGRYQMHELLRQYAGERLAQSHAVPAEIYALHSAYYADFLRRRTEDITGGRQRDVLKEITFELENIRAAWSRAVEQADVANIHKAAYTLYEYSDFLGRYQEAAEMFEKAAQCLERLEPDAETQRALALLLTFLGWHYIRLGRYERTKEVLKRSRDIYQQLNIAPPPGFGTDPLNALSLLANVIGDHTKALQIGEEALQGNEARGDSQNLIITFYVLAGAAFSLGQYERASGYARQAYQLAEKLNNRWMMPYILVVMGNIARAQMRYDRARRYYETGYKIKEEFDDPEGKAVALNYLGQIAVLEGDYELARQLYWQSLSIYEEIGDRGGLARTLNGLGAALYALGKYGESGGYFRRALEVAAEIQFVPLILSIFVEVAEMLLNADGEELATRLLRFVLQHAAGEREIKRKARVLLESFHTGDAALETNTEQPLELGDFVFLVMNELTSFALS